MQRLGKLAVPLLSLLICATPTHAQVSSCNGAPIGAACDTDGDPCTTIGTCLFGDCVGEDPLGNGTPCDDGLFCNGSDVCQGGVCTSFGNPCPGPDGDLNCKESCNESNDTCTANDPNGSNCNDLNQCTAGEVCFNGTCSLAVNVPNGTPCTSDGVFCNGAEECQSGSCVAPGDPCDGPDNDGDCSESCNESNDSCTANDPDGSSCTDGNECTTGEVCFSGSCSLAVHVPDGTPCTPDGVFCNGAEECLSGSCVSIGDPCGGPDGDADCSESCDESAGLCTGPDPDGTSCDDGLFCTGTEVCQSGGCVSSGDPCLGADGDVDCSESCDEASHTCTAPDPLDSLWGVLLTLERSVENGALDIFWTPTCDSADDYAVYEGALGDFTSHVPVPNPFCTTGGIPETTINPDEGDRYYLVVPQDVALGIEGAYGYASDGTPRPQSLQHCAVQTVCDCRIKTVFVTSVAYSGNLGGLLGADAKCQALADAADLGGTYKAWLSDDTTSASARLTHSTGPYVRTDGQIVADNWSDLTDNPSTDPLLAPIDRDQNGVAVGTVGVWTSSTFAGANSPFVGSTCQGWLDSTNASSGRTGRSNRTDLGWTSFATEACDLQRALYCFEQ